MFTTSLQKEQYQWPFMFVFIFFWGDGRAGIMSRAGRNRPRAGPSKFFYWRVADSDKNKLFSSSATPRAMADVWLTPWFFLIRRSAERVTRGNSRLVTLRVFF